MNLIELILYLGISTIIISSFFLNLFQFSSVQRSLSDSLDSSYASFTQSL